jgi:hypothetical protein
MFFIPHLNISKKHTTPLKAVKKLDKVNHRTKDIALYIASIFLVIFRCLAYSLRFMLISWYKGDNNPT